MADLAGDVVRTWAQDDFRVLVQPRSARRYERKAEHFQAFADLAAILVCYRRIGTVTD